MDVHQWHANTPIIEEKKETEKLNKFKLDYSRLSIVSYLRKNMIKCS